MKMITMRYFYDAMRRVTEQRLTDDMAVVTSVTRVPTPAGSCAIIDLSTMTATDDLTQISAPGRTLGVMLKVRCVKVGNMIHTFRCVDNEIVFTGNGELYAASIAAGFAARHIVVGGIKRWSQTYSLSVLTDDYTDIMPLILKRGYNKIMFKKLRGE